MIEFYLNNIKESYNGDLNSSLLDYLRKKKKLTALKDGCSGEGVCGACTVEIDGKARLACRIKMKNISKKYIVTPEGIPVNILKIIANEFVKAGAVQCGFCTPGFIMRTKILLQTNKNPNINEIRKAIKSNLCRCTGYKKIEEAILNTVDNMQLNKEIKLNYYNKVGNETSKYQAYQTAIGERKFTNDYEFENMLHGVLKFTDHPKAKIKNIDISEAEKFKGVVKILTAKNIPGTKIIGLIEKDQYVFIDINETTHYIGEALALIIADSEENAREATKLIKVNYEVLTPVTDVFEAVKKDSEKVHQLKDNLIDNCAFKRGNMGNAINHSEYSFIGTFNTQRIEHAFLETETAIALPDSVIDGYKIYSQGQGVYVDQNQIAQILNLPKEKIRVIQIQNGGGFGGKEDLSVQGFAALGAYHTQKPVKVHLTRSESIRMHPKRHPIFMNMELYANKQGKLTALKLRAIGDTGAYASVGTKVLERVAGHATGGYYVPNVDIEAKTVYTNNIPCGAMRGFGANQVAFALESCIDEICKQAGFDRWQFRYDNALTDGLKTATGQAVKQVGIQACLEAVKKDFYNNKYVGLACAIKNSGVGNGMIDYSDVIIEIHNNSRVKIKHGWSEMGQGVHTIAIQFFCSETGVLPENVDLEVDTNANINTGMTTSSRATALLGNAIIDACKILKEDLKKNNLSQLAGKIYIGRYEYNQTTKPGVHVNEQITHYSYGYAAQLCILNEDGTIKQIVAAHDAGKIVNPTLFKGQIEGAVHMGLGYALTENLPMKNGYLLSDKLKDCGVLRIDKTPDIKVIGVEVPDKVGPYGVKGIGEIGLVPTAAAVANVLTEYDGIRRFSLPLQRI